MFSHLGRAPLQIAQADLTGFLRIYRAAYPDALGFGKSPSRFSDPRVQWAAPRRFGVLYLGSGLRVCFAEAVLRDRVVGRAGTFYLTETEIGRLNVVEVRSTRPLRLVDLRGDNLLRMRLPTDLARARDHSLGQHASLAFYQHADQPDGILYHSRLNEGLNVAIYGRAVRWLRKIAVGRLLDDARLARILNDFDVALTP